jgi:ribosomal protein S18 acetylase RimI-like enzyme
VEGARAATRADLADVVRLAEALRDELVSMRGGDLWSAREARPEPLEVAFGALLERDDALLVVGTIDDAVVGFGALEIETLRTGDRLGRITDLFVEVDARSVGVGEAMVEDLVERCRALDCIGIDTLALPGHRAAKNFFEEHGFTARSLVMHHSLREQ